MLLALLLLKLWTIAKGEQALDLDLKDVSQLLGRSEALTGENVIFDVHQLDNMLDDISLADLVSWTDTSGHEAYTAFAMQVESSSGEWRDMLTCRTCGLLHEGDSHAGRVGNFSRKKMVVLLPNSDQSKHLFDDMDLPGYDSEVFLIEKIVNESLVIHEAYSKGEGMSLTKNLVEVWSEQEIFFHAENIWERRSNLQGLEFKVIAKHNPPFSVYNETKYPVTGFNIEVLNEIARRMNFTMTYVDPTETRNKAGRLLDLLQDGLDMSSIFMYITQERLDVIDYTSAVNNYKLYLVTKMSGFGSNTHRLTIFQTLSNHVWFTILATVIVLVAAGLITKEDLPLQENVMTVYGGVLGRGTEKEPVTISYRILFWTSLVFGILLVNAFSARLIATLSIAKEESTVKSLEDVRHGSVSNKKLFLQTITFRETGDWV